MVFARIGGPQLAVEALRKRAGGMFDPSIVEAFARHATGLIEQASTGDPRDLILAAEPEPVAHRDAAQVPELATVFADLADLKTPFTHGHSREVSRLAGATAERLRLDPATASRLRLAGLLHDLGRIAISTAIWEKPGPLSTAEWDQVRLHPYHSERILASSTPSSPSRHWPACTTNASTAPAITAAATRSRRPSRRASSQPPTPTRR